MQPDHSAPKQAPGWLKRIQENSWEPEIIISSVTLAFIFAFPAELYQFTAGLIQEEGMEYLGGSLTLYYLSFVVNIFKIFFVVHLCLRFAWIGAVGASYAFPKGVIRDALFKYSKDDKFTEANTLVLKLERVCSMAFGMPLMLSIYILVFSAYLLLLGILHITFGVRFDVLYVIFMVSIIGFLAFSVAKKSAYKAWYTTSLAGSLGAIYTSNLGKWKMNLYMALIFVLATPFITHDTKNFSLYHNSVSMPEEIVAWNESVQFSDSYLAAGNRVPRIMIKEDPYKPNELQLFLAHFEEDNRNLPSFNEYHSNKADSLGFNLDSITGLHKILVDDSLHTDLSWQPIRLSENGQRFYTTRIATDSLEAGLHEIRIEKLVLFKFFSGKGKLRYRKDWAIARFLK